ncbi:hypothetical protein Goklo_015825, partial [Gossypium klotzschianum]|nr:hypothetical protein [Gossypium klotzschianum]
MTENLQKHQTPFLGGVDCSCLFGIISLRIWRNHNLFTFQGISWSIDEVLKVCLSTDGLVRNEECFAAVGRLVRDHNAGRFKRASIQTDNLEAANAIQDGSSESSNSALVRRIHQLLKM